MKHNHHIKPRYEGGSDDPSNLVLLTPTQHAMWHYAEWLRKGNWQDDLAWRVLCGRLSKEASIREAVILHNRSRKGKKRAPRSQETREKISRSVREFHATRPSLSSKPESKPKARCTGNRGRKPKPVELTSPCGMFAFVFSSSVEAAEALGLWAGNVTKVARGEWKQTCGWRARYI